MIVVEHPFGGGRDGAALVDRVRNRTVRGEQHFFVVAQARAERTPEAGLPRDGLRRREAARMLLQPFDAEDFLAQDLFVVPMRTGRDPFEETLKEWVQVSASCR